MIRSVQMTSMLGVLGVITAFLGCTKHTVTVEPIRVEPIHLTIDVNVRVDRELDEFFDYKKPPTAEESPASSGSSRAPSPEQSESQGANS